MKTGSRGRYLGQRHSFQEGAVFNTLTSMNKRFCFFTQWLWQKMVPSLFCDHRVAESELLMAENYSKFVLRISYP